MWLELAMWSRICFGYLHMLWLDHYHCFSVPSLGMETSSAFIFHADISQMWEHLSQMTNFLKTCLLPQLIHALNSLLSGMSFPFQPHFAAVHLFWHCNFSRHGERCEKGDWTEGGAELGGCSVEACFQYKLHSVMQRKASERLLRSHACCHVFFIFQLWTDKNSACRKTQSMLAAYKTLWEILTV